MWLLIAVLVSSMDRVDLGAFPSENACLRAGEKLDEAMSKSGAGVLVKCERAR